MKKPIAYSKIRCQIFLFIVLLLNFQIRVYADVQILTSKDGLSENQITAITKDKIGRIWIGTTNGLNVFDGYSVHRIPNKTLSNADITDLAIDSSTNILWVGTGKGLFGIQTQSMRRFPPVWKNSFQTTSENSSGQAVVKIILNQSNGQKNTNLIIFRNGQIALLDGHTLQPILQLPETKINNCSAGRFPDGDIFLFINKKNYRFSILSKNIFPVADFGSGNFYVNKVCQYDKSQLLVCTFNRGLYLYNLVTHQITVPDFLKRFNDSNPRNVLETVLKKKRIYVVMDNYNFSSINTTNPDLSEHISAQNKTAFDGRRFNCLFVDGQSTVWMGTNKGLLKLPDKKRLFHTALQSATTNISTRNIIQTRNKDIFVATYNGLFRLNSSTRHWQQYQQNHTIDGGTQGLLYKGKVQPYTLLPDVTDQNLLIGVEGSQILKFNIERKKFYEIPYRMSPGQKDLPGIFGVIRTPMGNVIAASPTGLFSLTNGSNDSLNLRWLNIFPKKSNIRIQSIDYSKTGKSIIIGTTNGLYILNNKNQIQTHLSTSTIPNLSNNDVLCFLEDNKGNIWVGTNGGGLNKVSPDLQTVTYVNSEEGLSNDIIYDILSDSHQNLWISTFDGLNYYNPKNGWIRCYYKEQGLPTDEFNRHSAFKASDGRLYFGSINGIIYFQPDSMELVSLSPFKIFLSGITKWDAQQKSLVYNMSLPVAKDEPLRITKHKNDLITELHFACSDYSMIAKNKFQYRIKGITKGWTSITGSNSFNINGIPFGQFLLEVRAINYRGQISENTLLIYINNVKPFFQHWWFYALCLLIISGILYTIFALRLHKYKSSAQLRMRIASSLHDEVGSILTRITMTAESLNFIEKTNLNKLRSSLSKLATLSREATASMSDVLWAVDSRNDFSGSLTDRMQEHAEEMFSTSDIEITFDFSASKHDTRLPQVLRKELYLIYKESLHNIAKHAPKATFIGIKFDFRPHSFCLMVTNDGVEKPPKEHATGQGLKNIQKRAKAIGAQCHISRSENNHTFKVTILKQ